MMAYMKWVSLIRDAVKEQSEKGMLGVLAATTNIPEYRLRDWTVSRTIDDLSHTELNALHDALSEKVNVPEAPSPQRELIAGSSSSSDEQVCGFAFDSSD